MNVRKKIWRTNDKVIRRMRDSNIKWNSSFIAYVYPFFFLLFLKNWRCCIVKHKLKHQDYFFWGIFPTLQLKKKSLFHTNRTMEKKKRKEKHIHTVCVVKLTTFYSSLLSSFFRLFLFCYYSVRVKTTYYDSTVKNEALQRNV